VDLDSRIADCADGDWKGEALQQREVDVDVEPLRLETGEAAGDGLELEPILLMPPELVIPPELVAEVTYLTWAAASVLRMVY
jgi:hypothetical protein